MTMSRGGMCKNPFGGYTRPDKLDPWLFLPSNAQPEQAIFVATIKDAMLNYLYFGLGGETPDGGARGNGTTAANFYFDFRYFFEVRSTDRATWESARTVWRVAKNEVTGKRERQKVVLSDAHLQFCCFDFQYSQLGYALQMDEFLALLREHRKAVLDENVQQILEYTQLLRTISIKRYAAGHALPLFVDASANDLRILLEPRTPKEVADLVGYMPKCYKTRKAREPYLPTVQAEVIAAGEAVSLRYKRPEGPLHDCVTEAPVPGVVDDLGNRSARLSA